MQGLRDVFGEGVELGAADGADGDSGAIDGGRGMGEAGVRLGGVAGGGFERGQARGESDVEEGPGRKGEERVMCCQEEVGEVVPAGR